VISDLDIWRAAHMLIERHGAEALTEAAKMIDKMLDGGDMDGRAVWLHIRHAITELQAQPSGLVH
jgi:hypothetical protein